MTFLQLFQRFCRECDVTASASAINQTGESQRMADWVNAAWMDVQGVYKDWDWLRVSTSFATVAGQATYTPTEAGATNLGAWDRLSFRIYLTATGTSGEVLMDYIPYEMWRDTYQF